VKLRLKEERERAGLTQAQLADKSGVPQTTISGLESGKRSPNMDTAFKLADGLGIAVTRLAIWEKQEAKN
jgi:transcriptional regulator with XRE-family HTH domain